MEIDPLGRMWVLDSGSQNQAGGEFILGPPRVVLLDLTQSPPQVLVDYTFPVPVARAGNMTFLNDIVVDWRNDWAYISDTFADGGILFFDAQQLVSRRMTNQFTGAELQYLTRDFCGEKTITLGASPSDGIALSPDASTLYFCPLTGHSLYAIPTASLRDLSKSQQQLASDVTLLGQKLGMSDGLAMTSDGTLIYGSLESCALLSWDAAAQQPLTSSPSSQRALLQNRTIYNWADTFAFDGRGSLLFTTNRLAYFFAGEMVFDGSAGSNFRIFTFNLGVESYMSFASHSHVSLLLILLTFCIEFIL